MVNWSLNSLSPAEVNVKSTWSVLVLYENAQAREEAVEFCDQLVERFWAKFGFNVDWCSFEALEDRKSSEEFAVKAGDAEIVVFAHQGRREFSRPVRAWIETWLTVRGEREGKLVALCGAPAPQKCSAAFAYLRNVAHRAGMDFVTEVPQSIADPMPDSLDMAMNRAEHVTSLLDGILHHPIRPSIP
jgi:hypothetical protein